MFSAVIPEISALVNISRLITLEVTSEFLICARASCFSASRFAAAAFSAAIAAAIAAAVLSDSLGGVVIEAVAPDAEEVPALFEAVTRNV